MGGCTCLLKYRKPLGQLMLWKGEKDSMEPSMVMGWSLIAPREVTSIQWGDGPQMNTCTYKGDVRNGSAMSQFSKCGRFFFFSLHSCPTYPWVSRDVLKVSEPGNPTLHACSVLHDAALCLLIFLQLWFLFSEVDIVGHLCRADKQGSDWLHPKLLFSQSTFISGSSYFLEADFQVVLRLLLIVRERFVDQELLLHVNLDNEKTPCHALFEFSSTFVLFWFFY